MIDLNNIKLDSSRYQEMVGLIEENYGKNNGCILHPHWKKFSERDYNVLSKTGEFKSMSWMGGGFPEKTNYRHPFHDFFSFEKQFKNIDTVDVQSGIYQFHRISECFYPAFDFAECGNINVIEVGGGYGRLAMFFLAHFGEKCHYVNVDFAPTSLLYAPQVMQQMFPDLKVAGTFDLKEGEDIKGYNFVSLPAWRTDLLPIEHYDLGVNIHSFQEMKRKSVDFYSELFYGALKDDGILYIINNPPEKDGWYTHHRYYNLESLFAEVTSEKYPIGDDWEKICGIPTLERTFLKDIPDIIDTICSGCDYWYGMTNGFVETKCPKCGCIDKHGAYYE